jgi:hypothetical protein
LNGEIFEHGGTVTDDVPHGGASESIAQVQMVGFWSASANIADLVRQEKSALARLADEQGRFQLV